MTNSDGDDLNDITDPHPASWDGDEDGLSDSYELQIGTDVDNADTDADGLKDGEEVNGWGFESFETDPLDPDTDDDFASDSSEIKSCTAKLEDEYGEDLRVALNPNTTITFDQSFNTSISAQISFALAFCEYSNGTSVSGKYDATHLTIF